MQRLETFNSMRRTYDSAKFLNMKEKDIEKIFKDRGKMRELGFIKDNYFKPFTITLKSDCENKLEKLKKSVKKIKIFLIKE